MLKQNKQPIIVSSIENSSILRKFTVLFLVISLLPTIVLFYLYSQIKEYGQLQLSLDNFNVTLTIVVFGVLIGYFVLRSVFTQIMDLSKNNLKALENVEDKSLIESMGKEQNEITILAKSFNQVTQRLEDNIKKLETTRHTLHTVMTKIGQGISNLQNIDTFLDLILETVTDALGGRIGVLLLYDDITNELWVKSTFGVDYDHENQVHMKVLEGTTIHFVIKSRMPYVISNLDASVEKGKIHRFLFEPPMICVPLVMLDRVKGVITISGRTNNRDFDENEKGLLLNLAAQTAVAIENVRLNEDKEKTYFETIAALAMAVDAKDKYSRGHLDRVAKYCIQIGKKLKLNSKDIKILHDAAKLHDVGKIGIPDEVLFKKGKLSEEDWVWMKKHPEIGESIIKPIRTLEPLCDIVRHHHEKLDGTGYPDGLKGDEISRLVRIASIADIYDALTTDRPYRIRFSQSDAFAILRSMRGHLDESIVEKFIESFRDDSESIQI